MTKIAMTKIAMTKIAMTKARRTGLMLALVAAVISGFAIFLNGYGVKAVGNATVFTTAKNVVAALCCSPLQPRAGQGVRRSAARWAAARGGAWSRSV